MLLSHDIFRERTVNGWEVQSFVPTLRGFSLFDSNGLLYVDLDGVIFISYILKHCIFTQIFGICQEGTTSLSLSIIFCPIINMTQFLIHTILTLYTQTHNKLVQKCLTYRGSSCVNKRLAMMGWRWHKSGRGKIGGRQIDNLPKKLPQVCLANMDQMVWV